MPKSPRSCRTREPCSSIKFPLFLQLHPLPVEETFEEIAADEKLWDKQFARTSDEKLTALVASVKAEIDAGQTLPMFDERGKLIQHKRSFL